MEPTGDEDLCRDAEIEAFCRQITEEDPGFWDRLVARVLEEAKAENGGVTMEAFLGMPPDEEGQ
jgi:hypothetical protein